MSNGEPIVVRIAMKPLPTLMRPLRSARLDTHEAADALVERSDTTAIAAAAVVGEAVVAFELARCVREKFGGDSRRRHARRLRALPRAHPVAPRADRRSTGRSSLAGFMGAGKSTVGAPARPSPADARSPIVDAEVERRAGCSVRALFERDGEAAFRALEARGDARAPGARRRARDRARRRRARRSRETRALVRERAFCAWLDVPFGDRLGARRGRAGRAPAGGRSRALRARSARSARRALRERRRCDRRRRATPADDVAGALAQQVWTRPGIAELALRDGARSAIVDRALSLDARAAPSIELDGRRGREVAAGARAALARARRARARARRRDRVRRRRLGDRRRRASRRRRSGAASPGSPCPRRWSARWTRRSAARRRSTSPPRTTSARSGSRSAVLCDPELLETLPAREWAGGMAEVRQDGAARRRPAVGARRELGAGRRRARRAQPSSCSAARASRRSSSPPTREERGRRAILNLGHTIGHGIESVAGYGGLSHGECVSIGLVAALRLSEQLAGLDAGHGRRASQQLLAGHGLPVRAPGLDPGRGARGDAARQEAHGRHAPHGPARGDRAARARRRRRRRRARRARYARPPAAH